MLAACAQAAETAETAVPATKEGEGTETLSEDLAAAPDGSLISEPLVPRSESTNDLEETSSDASKSEGAHEDFLASGDMPDLDRAIEELQREIDLAREEGDNELEEEGVYLNDDEDFEDDIDANLKMTDETRMYDDLEDEDDQEGDDEYDEKLEKINHMFDNESYDDEYDGDEDGDYDEDDELILENSERIEDKSGEGNGAEDEEFQIEEAGRFLDTEESQVVEHKKKDDGDLDADVTVGGTEREISTESSDEEKRAGEASIEVGEVVKIDT